MNPLAVVILAAGKGTRMKSPDPKVLQKLLGRPLLGYVIDAAQKLSPEKIVVIVGYEAEKVKNHFSGQGVDFALQEEQLGTGHAVAQAQSALEGFAGDVLILSGDVPLIKGETLKDLVEKHHRAENSLTFLSTPLENPKGYGRVLRNEVGEVVGIVEEKDASPEVKKINEINAGIYCCEKEFLFEGLKKIDCQNRQGEYYLTDLVKVASLEKKSVGAVVTEESEETAGVNTLEELAVMEKRLQRA